MHPLTSTDTFTGCGSALLATRCDKGFFPFIRRKPENRDSHHTPATWQFYSRVSVGFGAARPAFLCQHAKCYQSFKSKWSWGMWGGGGGAGRLSYSISDRNLTNFYYSVVESQHCFFLLVLDLLLQSSVKLLCVTDHRLRSLQGANPQHNNNQTFTTTWIKKHDYTLKKY